MIEKPLCICELTANIHDEMKALFDARTLTHTHSHTQETQNRLNNGSKTRQIGMERGERERKMNVPLCIRIHIYILGMDTQIEKHRARSISAESKNTKNTLQKRGKIETIFK